MSYTTHQYIKVQGYSMSCNRCDRTKEHSCCVTDMFISYQDKDISMIYKVDFYAAI